MNDNMPTVEISLTLDELRAVTKSLSIGADQLARKVQRMGENPRANDISSEYVLLMEAKHECEAVLKEAMR